MRTSRTARSTVILQHGMRLDHARRRTGPQAFAVVAQKPFACASTVNVRPSSAVWRRFATSRGLSRSSPRLCVTPAPESIKISTFNMLCPGARSCRQGMHEKGIKLEGREGSLRLVTARLATALLHAEGMTKMQSDNLSRLLPTRTDTKLCRPCRP
eukprot:4222193-Pleurochrysis_carterae.AAC.3